MNLFRTSLLGFLVTAAAQPFSNCNVDSYYSSLSGASSSWSESAVHNLIKSTHLGEPRNNGNPRGEGDIWEALTRVEQADSNSDKVTMLYSQKDVNNVPFGGEFWQKEYVWPLSRGIGNKGKDFLDLHNIRATSKITQADRSAKYFGECGVLDYGGNCYAPAEDTIVAVNDTCSCTRAYQPPEAVRGEIARSLLYMHLRYDGSEEDTTNLRLTDCPFEPPTDMAYLTQMLTWNEMYPPTEREINRNNIICNSWQGNRNPFIDHSELATALYGSSKLPDPAPGREIYEACESIPTTAPTLYPNDCTLIEPGSIAFFFMNSLDPDEVGFFLVDDVPGNVKLYMTDNAWNGLEFQSDEGTISYVVPSIGLASGQFFGYGNADLEGDSEWKTEQGIFSLSTEGEQIFLYCLGPGSGNGEGENDDNGDIHFISAFSYNGDFDTDFSKLEYGFNESALPSELKDVAIQLPHEDNYIYNGPQRGSGGSVEELQALLLDPTNWQGGTSRYALDLSGSAPSLSFFTTSFITVGIANLVVVMSFLW